MSKPRSPLFIAAALSFALPVVAHAALPVRLRSAAAPAQTTSVMSMPLPTPAPPPPPPDFFPRISQGLSADVIRRVIWVHINQIKYCYQQALFKQPTLAGRMLVNFQVSPQGQVLELSVRESTLQSPQLLSCVSDAMRGWEFPPTPSFDGVIEINYPFLLRPRVPEPVYGVQVSDSELERLGVFKDPEPPQVDILF
jgi:TonB family protein